MLEFILIVIIAIGTIGHIAEGSTEHGSCEQRYKRYSMPYQACVSDRSNPVNTCINAVRAVVSTEDAPAAIEACQSGIAREHIRECNGKASCIVDEITDEFN